jgi:hypothetical protein
MPKADMYSQGWVDLSEKQQAKFGGDKSAFKQAKKDFQGQQQERADNKEAMQGVKDTLGKGASLQEMQDLNKGGTVENERAQEFLNKKIDDTKEEIYGGGIENFDGTQGGAGSKKGYDRFSKSDIKELRSRGASKEEIINYAETSGSDASGEKAQKLLNKYKDSLKTETQARPTAQDLIDKYTPNAAAAGRAREEEPDPVVVEPTVPDQPSQPIQPSQPSQPTVPSNPNVPPDGGNPYNPGNPVVDNSPVNNEATVDQNQELSNENSSTNIIDGNHNSIDNRQYSFGGNQTTNIWQQGHNIGGGHGGSNFVDTAASQMALGRSTDYDSPADTAEFVTRHSAINDMVQNKTPNYAQASIDAARSNKVVDAVALDKRISQRPLYMNAQSTMMGLNLFGDTFKFQAPDWESGLGTGDPADKPDLEGIADDIKDDIDDI